MAYSDETRRVSSQVADLMALADGTLPAGRRAEVEATIAASPELKSTFEDQLRSVTLIRGAVSDVYAPPGLREQARLRQPRRKSATAFRLSFGGGLAIAVAAALMLIVLVLPSGSPGAPTFSAAAALATRSATAAAPAADPQHPFWLRRGVGEVYFPDRPFGLRAVGQRIDRLGGHQAVTVFYSWRRERVAYTIISLPSLRQPAAAGVRVGGLMVRSLTMSGRQVVTWRRSGHTCVLSATGLTARQLERLAAWRPAATT